MNMTIKRITYGWRVFTTVFSCFLGISLFFIFSSVPQQFIGNFLLILLNFCYNIDVKIILCKNIYVLHRMEEIR